MAILQFGKYATYKTAIYARHITTACVPMYIYIYPDIHTGTIHIFVVMYMNNHITYSNDVRHGVKLYIDIPNCNVDPSNSE